MIKLIDYKKTLFGWLLFLVGLSIVMCIDYVLRNSFSFEMPEMIWFLLHFILGGIGLFLLWNATDKLKLIMRIVTVGLQSGIVFVIYLLMTFYYVVYIAKIDSL